MNALNTEDSLAAFAREWQEYHGTTLDHRANQRRVLLAFADTLGDRSLLEATGDDLRAYLELRLETCQPSTVLRSRRLIRPFYTWAFEKGLLDDIQYMRIRSARGPRGAGIWNPRPYNEKEIARIWVAFDAYYPWCKNKDHGDQRDPQPITEARGRMFFDRWLAGRTRWYRARQYAERLQAEAILQLAMAGGLRRREVYGLSPEAIHPDNEYVIVEGARKGTRRTRLRVVPWITDTMRDSCELWLLTRGAILDTLGIEGVEETWLTLNPTGAAVLAHPMSTETFDAKMRKLGYEFHRLRHTAATEMLRGGYSIGAVSKILGHASLSMTMRYLEFIPDDLVYQANVRRSNLEKRLGRPHQEDE